MVAIGRADGNGGSGNGSARSMWEMQKLVIEIKQ
jgi:hypothetical protein